MPPLLTYLPDITILSNSGLVGTQLALFLIYLWSPTIAEKFSNGVRNMDYLNLDTGVIWAIALCAGTFLITLLAIWGII